MERVAESKALPVKLPAVSRVSSNVYVMSGREASQAPKLQTGLAALGLSPGQAIPPEPIDTDLIMKAVYVPIGQKKAEPGCLMKSRSVKGPFLEDLSIRVPPKKPSLVALSPAESLIEEPNGLAALPTPFSVPRASQNTENSLLPPDSEENECVWDTSLPPSGNVSPHSSIDSTGVVTAMSIVNSRASTYRSDAITSDGMLSIDRNCESTKGSVRGDSLESAKTSVSRASDSSGLSDDSNWSSITSANKPHKGNDPRWKAILAIRTRDGLLGMNHFKLFKRLGCGDIGSVYLSELSGTRCFFAMKVMDKASLASRKKLTRAQTEREILQLLDHPFLPTLYTHFETDRFLCLVMEYCPGGDLHTLRQRQPGKHFSEYAARKAHVDGSLPQFKFDCLYIMPVTVHVDGSLPQFKFDCLYMVPVTVVNCKDGDIAS
ncbi:hypothetical protein OIU76_006097 [Salix suchowensis]|nr:hypothetical protein OIU76_006097 [Salix suchowensis]